MLPADCQEDRDVTDALERFIDSAPNEVVTLVEAPAEIAPEDSINHCLQNSSNALAHSLWAAMPYARIFVELSRCIRARNQPLPPANLQESRALLCSYHYQLTRRARQQAPEVWDVTSGKLVFDSRGVRFAFQLFSALMNEDLLKPKSRFLDIGSGIGTMPIAAALACCDSASGIELHPQLARYGATILHRLSRFCPHVENRVTLLEGDYRHADNIDLKAYDLIYVYSALGEAAIDLDDVVQRMRPGAVLVSERLPSECLDRVSVLGKPAGLFAVRLV